MKAEIERARGYQKRSFLFNYIIEYTQCVPVCVCVNVGSFHMATMAIRVHSL